MGIWDPGNVGILLTYCCNMFFFQAPQFHRYHPFQYLSVLRSFPAVSSPTSMYRTRSSRLILNLEWVSTLAYKKECLDIQKAVILGSVSGSMDASSDISSSVVFVAEPLGTSEASTSSEPEAPSVAPKRRPPQDPRYV